MCYEYIAIELRISKTSWFHKFLSELSVAEYKFDMNIFSVKMPCLLYLKIDLFHLL